LRLARVIATMLVICLVQSSRAESSPQEPKVNVCWDKPVPLHDQSILGSIIQVANVKRENLCINVEALGTVPSDTERTISVFGKLPGTVDKILVALGDAVEEGQVLLQHGRYEIKAPQAGIVVGLNCVVRQPIRVGSLLMTLADTTRLRCVFDIYESDIGKIREGQTVMLRTTAYPRDIFSGTVSYISPRVNENSRSMKVRVDVDNTQGKLKFGMSLSGNIQVDKRPVLVVPETAIQDIAGQKIVFIVQDDHLFYPRVVELGDRTDGYSEVKSGLKEGQTIVSRGALLIKMEWLGIQRD